MSRLNKIVDKYCLFSFFIVAVCEAVQCYWMSALGWFMAGLGWYAWEGEKQFYDMLADLYRKHLRECKCNNETKDETEKKDND